MAGGRKSGMVLLLVAGFFALSNARALSTADERAGEYRVIVNPANPVRQVGRAFLRDAFLKKASSWGGDLTIRPVDLSGQFPARQRFTREVLNKTPAQLRAYWNQLIFSGKAVPPPELDSEAAVISYVLRHRGAVGYLPATADPQGAAVVTLR